jgi:ADP-heptose:LPS heptosyltransferase
MPPWIESPYWIVNAGVKSDFTLKQWPVENYQAVVNHFRGKLAFAQIGEKHHNHPKLSGVVQLVGKTSLREVVRLVFHAAGGIGPITFLQHLCAAWEKPYVAILGGREPAGWVAYPRQHTLHTIGAAWAPEDGCCRGVACWKSRLAECAMPVREGLVRGVGRCMAEIRPSAAIEAIERVLA